MTQLDSDLTFKQFQELNQRRCRETFHQDEPWPLENWCLAVAGEAGELCNLVKKIIRGDFSIEEKRQDVLHEVADVMTYCDLIMSHLGADTATEIMGKFRIVSARYGWEAA